MATEGAPSNGFLRRARPLPVPAGASGGPNAIQGAALHLVLPALLAAERSAVREAALLAGTARLMESCAPLRLASEAAVARAPALAVREAAIPLPRWQVRGCARDSKASASAPFAGGGLAPTGIWVARPPRSINKSVIVASFARPEHVTGLGLLLSSDESELPDLVGVEILEAPENALVECSAPALAALARRKGNFDWRPLAVLRAVDVSALPAVVAGSSGGGTMRRISLDVPRAIAIRISFRGFSRKNVERKHVLCAAAVYAASSRLAPGASGVALAATSAALLDGVTGWCVAAGSQASADGSEGFMHAVRSLIGLTTATGALSPSLRLAQLLIARASPLPRAVAVALRAGLRRVDACFDEVGLRAAVGGGRDAASGSSDLFDCLPGAGWTVTSPTGVIIDGLSARSNGAASWALLNVGVATGRLSWTMVIDEDTRDSECQCFGFGRRTPPGSAAYDLKGNGLWLWRAYNGSLYANGTPLTPPRARFHKGDAVRFELDMEARECSAWVNDDDQGVIFRDLPSGTMYPACQFYSHDRACSLTAIFATAGTAVAVNGESSFCDVGAAGAPPATLGTRSAYLCDLRALSTKEKGGTSASWQGAVIAAGEIAAGPSERELASEPFVTASAFASSPTPLHVADGRLKLRCMRLCGRPVARGLAMPLPSDDSDRVVAIYVLNGIRRRRGSSKYTLFEAVVGLADDDDMPALESTPTLSLAAPELASESGISPAATREPPGSVLFTVVGDGRQLWSWRAESRGAVAHCLVAIDGVERLVLEVSQARVAGKGIRGAVGLWGDARVRNAPWVLERAAFETTMAARWLAFSPTPVAEPLAADASAEMEAEPVAADLAMYPLSQLVPGGPETEMPGAPISPAGVSLSFPYTRSALARNSQLPTTGPAAAAALLRQLAAAAHLALAAPRTPAPPVSTKAARPGAAVTKPGTGLVQLPLDVPFAVEVDASVFLILAELLNTLTSRLAALKGSGDTVVAAFTADVDALAAVLVVVRANVHRLVASRVLPADVGLDISGKQSDGPRSALAALQRALDAVVELSDNGFGGVGRAALAQLGCDAAAALDAGLPLFYPTAAAQEAMLAQALGAGAGGVLEIVFPWPAEATSLEIRALQCPPPLLSRPPPPPPLSWPSLPPPPPPPPPPPQTVRASANDNATSVSTAAAAAATATPSSESRFERAALLLLNYAESRGLAHATRGAWGLTLHVFIELPDAPASAQLRALDEDLRAIFTRAGIPGWVFPMGCAAPDIPFRIERATPFEGGISSAPHASVLSRSPCVRLYPRRIAESVFVAAQRVGEVLSAAAAKQAASRAPEDASASPDAPLTPANNVVTEPVVDIFGDAAEELPLSDDDSVRCRSQSRDAGTSRANEEAEYDDDAVDDDEDSDNGRQAEEEEEEEEEEEDEEEDEEDDDDDDDDDEDEDDEDEDDDDDDDDHSDEEEDVGDAERAGGETATTGSGGEISYSDLDMWR